MLARGARPKLTLNVATSTAAAPRSSSLCLTTPLTPLRSPASPRSFLPPPHSPTSLNTKLNQRGFSTRQQPTYAYANHSTTRSILKKGNSVSSTARRQLHFSEKPLVHCVTPIEDEDYYGSYRKMSRDERRWKLRSETGSTDTGLLK